MRPHDPRARQNNLKGIDVGFPLAVRLHDGRVGLGQSSLVGDILREALAHDLNGAIAVPGAHDRIDGLDQVDKVIDIDQSPIGRTPRSNPSTYIKLFDQVRDLYTQVPEAKAADTAGPVQLQRPRRPVRGVRGERLEQAGDGLPRRRLGHLPVLPGEAVRPRTLRVRFEGKSISGVLDVDVQEALERFAEIPRFPQCSRPSTTSGSTP